MAKKNGGSRAAAERVPVRYRDASELSGSLAGLAKEVPLPMADAMRVALMRRTADAAAEAFEGERLKLNRVLVNGRKKDDDPFVREVAQLEASEALRKKGSETFDAGGRIAYATIKAAVGEKKPENLGNILAGLMPVLEGVPEEE